MKLNKTIIISDILSIALAFVLFIIIFIEMKCVAIVYDKIFNNLFIKDFSPIQTLSLGRSLCQEEGMTSIINYTFPGIQKSCYENSTNKIYIGKNCSSINKKGLDIKDIDKKNFSIWRNKVICGKSFVNDISTYKFVNYNESSKCETGYKQCGHINNGGDFEKCHKLFCVKENVECPLNFLKITKDISPYKNSSNYNISLFENDTYLVTSNKMINEGIIMRIRIAEGDYPCYEKGKYSNNSVQFPSINDLEDFNCSIENSQNKSFDSKNESLINEGYDIRYHKFDNLIKYEVLRENDFDIAYSRLPNLPMWSQDMNTGSFNLFYLNQFIIKEECSEFNILEHSIENIRKYQASRVIFALFHILIYVILFSVLGLMKVIFVWRHSLLFGIKVFISLIIFAINLTIILLSHEPIQKLNKFQNLEECLDNVSKSILEKNGIGGILDDLTRMMNSEIIIWFAYLFFNVIEAFRLINKIYIRHKNNYRRAIANKEIGSENLKQIFEKVRNDLEKKRKNII
jgi:hypothetical protein